MDVSKLEGADLDRAVAEAMGVPSETAALLPIGTGPWAFSTDWSIGGLIIERERIELTPIQDGTWRASMGGRWPLLAGPTPLIAAMRAYVEAKQARPSQSQSSSA